MSKVGGGGRVDRLVDPSPPGYAPVKIWGRSGVSGYLYDFDIYQSKTNDIDTHNLVVSVVIKMAFSLPDGHNFKLFADNYFTSLLLVQEVNKRDILYVGTIRLPRMKNVPWWSRKI